MEDLAGATAPGKHIDLVGDPGPGRVDQVDHRDAGGIGPLNNPDDLLDGARAPGSGLDRGSVRHEPHRPSADRGRTGDHAVSGQAVGEHVGESAVLAEAARIGEQRDPVSREQLAVGRRGLVIPGRAALGDPGPDLRKLGMARDAGGGGAGGRESCVVRFYVHGRERTESPGRPARPHPSVNAQVDARQYQLARISQARIVPVRGPALSTCDGSCRPMIRSASAAASIIASRSMPVATPMSSTMWTSSSVAILPVAPGAYGHPPSPPTEASKSATPSSSAVRTLASPVPRVLWKCRLRGTSGYAERNSPTSSRTRPGVAIPVVSPNETVSAPSATARPATRTTRSTGTSPSYGQPHAVDTITWQVAPRRCASAMMTAMSSSDSSVPRLTFLRLWVSEADTTASISASPQSRARLAPRRFGTRAE